jgi:two-component system, OmpR family, phosphate regulon sensor histidine kinase PhoR
MISVSFLPGALVTLSVFVSFLSDSPFWFAALASASVISLRISLFLSRITSPLSGRRKPDQKTGAGADHVSEFSSHLLSTVNEMREGLLVIDEDMRVVASNRAAGKLFSHVDGSIDSRRLTELTRNPAIYDAFLDAVRGTERSGVKVETYDKERRVFDLRVVPLNARARQGPTGAVGVFFDVTRLERLETIRQEFLSNVSHELRTPLTSIMALSETLEAGAIDDRENNRRFLAIIQKNARRMHRLIDDILELGAIEAGNVKVSLENVALLPLVEDVICSLSAFASSRNVSLKNLIEENAEVLADPHRLVQMLTNLVDNAIKFNRNGGSVTILYEAAQQDRIRVQDTGEGIPAHHLDRLFERFYRVDRARSRELGGTGLGLAIVKHLAKAHGGEVTVDSRIGEGTQFTIELPRRTAIPLAKAAHR